MTDSKYDISKGKELYKAVTSLSNLDRTEEDFLGRLQDQEYAKKVYNTFKEDNLLGAKDEQSFLDSLGFNKSSEQAKVEQSVPQKDSSSFFGVQMPNIDDSLSIEIPQVAPVAPKTPDLTIKTNLDNTVDKLGKGELRISDIVGETQEQRVVAEINSLGGDKIADLANAEGVASNIQKQLDELNNQYGSFLAEYEMRQTENTASINDPWMPSTAGFRRRRENADFLSENSKLYEHINAKQKALYRQKELVDSYKQYAEFGRQLEVGKRLSSYVSSGKISDDTFKILRSTGSEKAKEEYLTRLYNRGEIDKETLKGIYNLGDLTERNGFLYGTFKTGKWEDILSLGINELERNLDIAGIVRRMKDGERITNEERDLLNMYFKLSDIQRKALGTEEEKGEYGWAFKSGVGFQDSLRFIAEMGLTAGVFGASTNVLKSFGVNGTKALIEKYGAKKALGLITGRIGERALAAAKHTALTVPAIPSAYSNWSERVLGYELDNENKASIGRMIWELKGAYVDTFTEMFSEALGGIVDDVPLWTLITRGKATKEITEGFLGTLARVSEDEGFKNTVKALRSVGVTGVLGEVASELSGNVMNGVLNLDPRQFAAFTDLDFYRDIALHSVVMAGMGNVSSYAVGGLSATVNRIKMQNMYDEDMNGMNNTEFKDSRMEELKKELQQAMFRQQYITTDASSDKRGVAEIVMEMSDLHSSLAPVDGTKEEMKSWLEEGKKLDIIDNAVRTGAYRYGEQQAIKDYVAQNLGVRKDEEGNIVPMEFEHEDGNVYEFIDTDGSQYFILDDTGNAVVLMDRTSGEKVVSNKSIYDLGTIKQTNANDWAMNELLLNSATWNARAPQTQTAVASKEFVPATMLEIDGQYVPVKSYDPKTDKYTITDGNGNEVEVGRTDKGVVEVEAVPGMNNETPVQPPVAEVPVANETPIANETNGIDTNSVAPEQGVGEVKQEEEQFKVDENGKRIWTSVSHGRTKQEIDSRLGEEQGRKYVKDQIKAAKKAVKDAEKGEVNELDWDKRIAQVEAIGKATEKAKADLEYWEAVDKLYDVKPEQEVTEVVPEQPVAEVEQTPEPTAYTVETTQEPVWTSMSAQDAKAGIDERLGENAVSFIESKVAEANDALSKAEKVQSMAKNATSDVKARAANDVDAAKKNLAFWTDVLNLYTQSNTANTNATTEQTGQVSQDTTSGENIGENNSGNGETYDISADGNGGAQGEVKEGENNNRPIAESSKDIQDELRKAGLKFEEAFDNINGNGNTDWRRWVDSSPREAPLMQAILKKAQEEARENGGYISDETYSKLEMMIAEATSSNKDAVNHLYSAMVGESNSKKLVNFGKDTYLGQKNIQKGVVYGIDTVEKLFNEVPQVDGDIQQLADKVFSICKGLGIGVVFTNNKFGRNVIGYSSNRNVIRYKASYLNGDASSAKKKALFLHEAIHAVTAYALREENYSGLPMNMREAVDELNAIYKDLTKKGLIKGWYGAQNVREMVAELANPAFRDHLKSIKAFKDIINAVAKFFVGDYVLGSSNTDALEQTSAALNKLLDLFNKELYDNYNKSTGLYEAQDEGSIDTMYESVGLRYEKGANGETIIKDADGNVVDEITEDMINESPLGASLVDAVKNGMITEEDRKKQLEFFKGLFNLQLRTNDLDLVYAVSGAIGFQPVEPGPRDMSKSDLNGKKQPFAALTSNADKQYSTTIDFTTICKKTQAVINNMSSIMVKLGRGLTKEEIVDIVFKNTHKAGEPVPCPVCYVFSRWVGLGGLFDNIKKLQEKYKDADVDALRKEINVLNEKVDNIAKARGMKRTKAKDELRKNIQKELNSLRYKEEKGEKLTRKEKNVAKMLEEQLFQIDNLTWLTDVRLGEGYKPVPDNILFDINAGVEFASEYPLTWKFRTTRGPSMGKAASPYSPLHFGQVMLGIGKSDLNDIKDPAKNTVLQLDENGDWTEDTKAQVEKSRGKAKVQNLLNGQRLQSTSDWRFEYALDQLLAMIELQNIGAKAQLYTKVAEAIRFFASCNAEVNCSLMPKGDGYITNEHGTMELVFSRVTGMDERDAFIYSNEFDNVQPILVGVNDTHMRLAMRDNRITFIIPFHASGGAETQYKSMMQALEERVDDKREDYSDYQSDRRLPKSELSDSQKAAYDLRYRILNSKKTGDKADTGNLSRTEKTILENNEILRSLYERFFGKTIDGKDIAEKDQECYLVSVGSDQAKLIFPYEYWDKTSTIENADVNGARFISYCDALGIVPRFSGVNADGKYSEEKDFTNERGYWKTLIDRRMYNNDGTYHVQKPVDVTNLDASYIDPNAPRPEIHTPSRNNNPEKEAEVVEKSIKDIFDAERRAKGIDTDTNDEAATVGKPAGYSTNTIEMTGWDKVLHSIQDRMRPVKALMDEITRRGGIIDETSDPHNQEVLASPRADSEIKKFKETKYEPLAKAISNSVQTLVDKLNMTAKDARDAVNDFLYARHAIERNKQICVSEIEQKMMDSLNAAFKSLVDKKVASDLAARHNTQGGAFSIYNVPYGVVEQAREDASRIYNDSLIDDNMKAALAELASMAYDAKFRNGQINVDTSALNAEQKELFNIMKAVAENQANEISKKTAKDESTGKTVVVANNRSGMSDAEANKILQDYYTPETSAVLDEMSDKVREATNFTLDTWLEYGLISQEEYDKYKNQYKYYIPLRGWEDKEDIDYTELPSKQFNMASELVNLNTHAEGRWSKAENPLAYIASLAMSATITGNRNLIRQNAFNMIDKNAAKVADLAVIENTYELYDEDGNLIGFSRKAPSKALFDKGLVKVRKDLTYNWNKTASQLGAHRVPVMIDGVRHIMYFKGKLGAQVATAINGTGNDTRNIVIQNMAKYTRWISSNLTAKNAYFIAKNMVRDLMFGNFAYFVENGFGKGWKLNKNFGHAFKVAFNDAMGKTTDPLYDEFKRNGGQTGYIQLESIDKLGKEMEKLIEQAGKEKGKGRIAVEQAAKLFEACGVASENAMRFAVYKLERESGASAREAAIKAKEITVNFNRQGKNSKHFNALFAFFNPAIQGSYRFFNLAYQHPKRFALAMGTMFAVKMALAWACQAATGGDDEEEGKTAYDRLSDYVKATNYCIPLGGDKFLCIPIAQSVRGTLSVADGLVSWLYGKKDIKDVFKDYMMFNIGEFAPLDIDAIDLTGDEPLSTVLQAATPTIARPIMEAYVLNRDFMGNPVHKEPYLRDDDVTPQHQLAFNSTTPFLVGTSKMLNELAGGDEKRSAKYQISQNGLIDKSGLNIFDINPASVEHVLSGYFGGPAKVFIDMYNVAYGATSKDVDIQNESYPILNQFLKEPTSKPGYKEFYEMVEYGKAVENLFGEYGADLGKPDTDEKVKNMFENNFNIKSLEMSKQYGDQVRDKTREIMSAGSSEDKERLTRERDEIVKDAAQKYSKLKKQFGIK